MCESWVRDRSRVSACDATAETGNTHGEVREKDTLAVEDRAVEVADRSRGERAVEEHRALGVPSRLRKRDIRVWLGGCGLGVTHSGGVADGSAFENEMERDQWKRCQFRLPLHRAPGQVGLTRWFPAWAGCAPRGAQFRCERLKQSFKQKTGRGTNRRQLRLLPMRWTEIGRAHV